MQIINPNKLVKKLAPDYGLSKTSKGILIRLCWKKGKPLFQKLLSGDPNKLKEQARDIRDAEALKLIKTGCWIPTIKRQPKKQKNNKTGVAGISFTRERAKTGRGWYLYWSVSWTENKKINNKTFYFTVESARKALKKAIKFRQEKELLLYDYTLIDMEKFDAYWHNVQTAIKLDEPEPENERCWPRRNFG